MAWEEGKLRNLTSKYSTNLVHKLQESRQAATNRLRLLHKMHASTEEAFRISIKVFRLRFKFISIGNVPRNDRKRLGVYIP